MATDNPFWRFSLAVYSIDDVAPACLRLQDRHGLDVNLLLYCCWAGRCGIAFDAPAMTRLLELTADWSVRVVQPLRSVRRALKGSFENMPDAARTALRDAVSNLELESERIEQAVLMDALPPKTQTQPSARRLAEENLNLYLAAVGVVTDKASLADLERLVSACEAWRV